MNPAFLTVRQATPEDFDRIRAFYAPLVRKQINPDERCVIAEHDRAVVGAVRLCREEGHVVLRTMQIHEAYQRRGLGARMLRALEPLIEAEPCYCLPYEHLPGFYRTIGFQIIDLEAAPPHLQARYTLGSAQGLRMLLMMRPAGPRAEERHTPR
ncbi:MAG TPA: GNAT family N-acetyltransferase [Herpetosiphonaceae bacterium]